MNIRIIFAALFLIASPSLLANPEVETETLPKPASSTQGDQPASAAEEALLIEPGKEVAIKLQTMLEKRLEADLEPNIKSPGWLASAY